MALIDFTLSNARPFYSSMGNPLDGKGFKDTKVDCPMVVPVRGISDQIPNYRERMSS